ncbi:thiazole tautomerase TenI [Priestia taiwanensis]|uniref:Thiamine phosphate synthase n=1 Tax=Priestia taiwanensis TaxID=1347902 RepID=A0A917AR06_9BACI|nr:thiazole tautomerase TenI [Priestia taiwanensis]MBM7363088.1 thiazole tautomerase (transcriptional regulator TenI) [Priestia taiwanensis]GGE67597.1 thiamine phosphate synthase [Priestia taiwanensis]
MDVHLISNGRQPFSELTKIAMEVESYIDFLHIREREKTAQEIIDGIVMLRRAGFPLSKLVMNDRIDIALVTSITNIHLGYRSIPVEYVKHHFPFLRVGCSVHSLDEARSAEQKGADYVMYGHLFATNSKPNLPPRGIEEIEAIIKQLSVPIVGVGGITPANCTLVRDAGIAVMSGILEVDNPLEQAKLYKGAKGNE